MALESEGVEKGTIVNVFDKGAVVALPYGVEGFATLRHIIKEDSSQAVIDEKLEFKVIEFSKAAKRIILSHTRVHEDAKKSQETTTTTTKRKVKAVTKKTTNKRLNINIEKTTLGDIADLTALRNKLEGKEDVPADNVEKIETKESNENVNVEANETKVEAEENKVEADETKVDAEENKVEADETKVDAEETKVEANETKVDADENKVIEENTNQD